MGHLEVPEHLVLPDIIVALNEISVQRRFAVSAIANSQFQHHYFKANSPIYKGGVS